RFGILFFTLLYLSLLGLTSIPVWRDERTLFLHERASKLYSHPPYFLAVALCDLLLVRALPPIVLTMLAYPLAGLNTSAEGEWCLLWFAGILVLLNVAVALFSMGIGGAGLPADLANLAGGIMVLLLTVFGRFLLNASRIPS
ncbi:unnamed protein product, partial [Discosporangium mesarthrocarpum]